ncbi:MAG TPA: metalloregulator ArsR/SmtB family transcription factor [Dermatophilaceae bacterium]|nr:metalloregulator ArsR/SmtB family transcription factor [Dermatophilaceae bacterium]HPZ69788.1 metalloregulator ArsR/SmtB family transcription factor [Dermatophilaceae bacterium]HQD02623.1 metalloregulator ArsR/SmtB family transcription factor [Dermatophilaceae bacterium]HQK31679.1 metalloregulator ArsR/SmtB family transcription factor [Phycicoccus sp.]
MTATLSSVPEALAIDADVCCPGSACDLLPAAPATQVAEVFKALADPTRVRLLHYLAYSVSGTACACHLPDALGISQPTLSFHMKKLHDAGLVTREKRGRWVHYTVRAEGLALVREFLDLPTTPGQQCC